MEKAFQYSDMNNDNAYNTIVPKSLYYSRSDNTIYGNSKLNVNINNKVNNNNSKNSNSNNIKHKKKNIITSATYCHFPQHLCNKSDVYIYNGTNDNCLTLDETLCLKTSTTAPTIKSNSNITNMVLLIHKSNSYTDGIVIKPKSTIIKQHDYNGRFNTCLHDDNDNDSNDNDHNQHHIRKIVSHATCSPSDFCTQQFNNLPTVNGSDNTATNENEASNTPNSTLMDAIASTTAATTSLVINNRCYKRSCLNNNSKSQRYNICYRFYTLITQYYLYLNYLVPFVLLIGLIFVAYLTSDYAKHLLYWIELQNPWIIFFTYIVLFIIVSFPIVVGYFILMLTAGYLFGFIKGLLTVILGANLGIFIAHLTLRNIRHRIPIQKIIKNETGRAILRVISGPKAFRVVLLTRLTPIPFGLQNTIFGISSINTRLYHIATFLGLLPAQIINVYVGSSLRSMQEVLNNQGTAVTGYISFAIELICGIALMYWVVRKARKELSNNLLTNLSSDNKLVDIQV